MKVLVLLVFLFTTPIFAEEVKVAAPVAAVAAPAEVVAVMPEEAPKAIHLPPAWLEKALDVAIAVPVAGPIVVEVLKWLGVISSVLTALVTALLGILWSLSKVLKLAKLVDLAVKVEALMNSPVMYWLKFLSMYNAKKVEKSGTDSKAA